MTTENLLVELFVEELPPKALKKLGDAFAGVLAEQLKLAPHITLMRERIAADMQVDIDSVSVKATTTEKLGFVGRREGIEAHAVVMLLPIE